MIDGMNSGEQLPSRSMIVKRFDSSRATVDKAINELEQEGVLESHRLEVIGQKPWTRFRIRGKTFKIR